VRGRVTFVRFAHPRIEATPRRQGKTCVAPPGDPRAIEATTTAGSGTGRCTIVASLGASILDHETKDTFTISPHT
jgi:hypothetical protein